MSSKEPKHLVSFNQIEMDDDVEYLVQDLIPRRDTTAVYGNRKSGKSFWVSDVAYHIAKGIPYRGLKTIRGPVVYLVYEGYSGFKKRMVLLRETMGEAEDFFIVKRLDKVTDKSRAEIIKWIEADGVNPVLLIFDTLNQSLHGDENGVDMSNYMTHMKLLGDHFQAACIVVHHTGVDQSRPRGHTSLMGTVAAQILVSRGKDRYNDCQTLTTEVELMKDGPEGLLLKHCLVKREWMFNGQTVSSCVVEEVPEDVPIRKAATAGKASSNGKDSIIPPQALKAFKLLETISAHHPMTFEEWKDVCTRPGAIATGQFESRLSAFRRSVDRLKAEGFIEIDGTMVKLARANIQLVKADDQ
jgi:AAA domain